MPPLNKFSTTCIAVGVVNALVAPCATAATITVGNTGDGDVFGPCTLRDAIATHNTSTNTGNCVAVGEFLINRIEFNLPNPSTISLVSDPLEITNGYLSIYGPGKEALTIDAANSSGAFTVTDAASVFIRDITVEHGAVIVNNSSGFRLDGAKISNNTVSGYGGGLFIDSSNGVRITDCEISNNSAYTGGGISILDSISTFIESSTIINNTATGNNGRGGGIHFGVLEDTGTFRYLDITDSTISNNTVTGTGFSRGGGISTASIFSPNNPARLNILRSNVSSNQARSGGGLHIDSGSDLNVITDSTISANTALSNGGGINAAFAAPVSFVRTTISENAAAAGGGIFGDSITMSNSTLSSNTATNAGSAIRHTYTNYAIPSIINQSTIVDNVGSPALFFDGPASNRNTFTLEANNVISNNALGNCSGDSTLAISFGTFNWLDDASCGTLNSGNPLLGELADNGGLTKTHAPMPGSGLIGAGLLSACSAAPVDGIDQRGQPRGTSSCFIGSVEGVVDPPDPTSFFVIPLANGKLVTIPL